MNISSPNSCAFGTYWKYGGDISNSFPAHWVNGTSCEIKNYMNYSYEMIHSDAECQVDTGETYPCQGVYFKKDTDISVRLIEI